MLDGLFEQILTSSVIVSIPMAIIYFLGTLINSRSVNRSKEDTCLYGLYFAMFFITIPSLIYYCVFQNNKPNFDAIDCIITAIQLIIILFLALLLKDIDKFLQMHPTKLYAFLLKYWRKLKIYIYGNELCGLSCRLSESSSNNNCMKNRCMNYCLLFFIFSSITIFSTLHFFLRDAGSSEIAKYISLVLSLILLSLVACNLPSVHNEYNKVKVYLSESLSERTDEIRTGIEDEGKDSLPSQVLSGQLLQNSDTLIKIFPESGTHIEINKAFIRYIEIDGIPKREKLLECVLSMPKNFVFLSILFLCFYVITV